MRIFALLLVVASVLVGVAGAYVAEGSLSRRRSVDVRARPPGYARVEVESEGATLVGLWKGGGSRCVLVLHGVGDGKESQAGLGDALHAIGYAVLLADSRAHGESGGELVTFGVRERRDVRVWRDWLGRQGCGWAAGVGASMGGSTLLLASASDPRWDAVVADSAFSSFRQVALDRVRKRVGPGLGDAVVWSGLWYAGLRYGEWLWDADVEAEMVGVKARVLLIHGAVDMETPLEHTRRLARACRGCEVWVVDGAGHTESAGKDFGEYVRRIGVFLEGTGGVSLGNQEK